MNKINKVKAIAKKKNINGEITASTRKGKKYMIVVDGKKIHFGADVRRAVDVKYSPSWLSLKLL